MLTDDRLPCLQVLTTARSALAAQTDREQARRVRRESLGLGALTTPNEFLCPITQVRSPLITY